MQDDDLLEFVKPSRLLSTLQVGKSTIKMTAEIWKVCENIIKKLLVNESSDDIN